MPEVFVEKEDFEKLFLLEFLIENVVYFNSKIKIEKHDVANLGETCAKFQFLNFPILEVCEDDFCPNLKPQMDSKIMFKSGKSCLFSLQDAGKDLLEKPFNVNVTISRKTLGDKKDSIVIGCSEVRLSGSFNDVLRNSREENSTKTSSSKTLKDTHSLRDKEGKEVGCITLFIRLSCFGKLIVTEFQVGGSENRSFLFKGFDGGPEGEPSQERLVGKGWEGGVGSMGLNRRRELGYGGDMNGGMPLSQVEPLSGGTTPPPWFGGGPEAFQQGGFFCVPCGPGNAPSKSKKAYQIKPQPKPPVTCQRLHLPQRAQEVPVPIPQYQATQPNFPKLNLCDCDYPVPPGLLPPPTPPRPQTPPPPPPRTPPCPLEPPLDARFCLNETCPMGYPPPPSYRRENVERENPRPFDLTPGTVGIKGDQVIFQMTDRAEPLTERDRKQAAATMYRMSTGTGPKNVIQVLPEPQGGPPPEQDENSDIFVLKIGKKNPFKDQKSKLELELRTPKLKESKVRTMDNETQFLVSDIPTTTAPIGKKGESGNKKGGKKGGKK